LRRPLPQQHHRSKASKINPPTPPPIAPPRIADKFEGEEDDDPDALEAFEGSRPVEEEVAEEEVREEEREELRVELEV